ncbi:MAG: hypothetical protein EOP49_07715 [Sphingobacteriales bacterium]|nr:MAG: hypothetical protein EOP49_07715 [Sphingobacteriales bacterium]
MQTQDSRVRLALQGASNSGLLYSALRIGQGIAGDWSAITVIDSTGSAGKFSHLGMYQTIQLCPPFTANRFYEAITHAEATGAEVVILNLTHSYRGPGGLLDQMGGPSFEMGLQAHRALQVALRETELHVLAMVNTRSRLSIRKGGKLAVAQEPLQEPNFDRNFQAVLSLDRTGKLSVLKDETASLPMDGSFYAGVEIGTHLGRWCMQGRQEVCDCIRQSIQSCNDLQELTRLFFKVDSEDPAVLATFSRRRMVLSAALELRPEPDMTDEFPF